MRSLVWPLAAAQAPPTAAACEEVVTIETHDRSSMRCALAQPLEAISSADRPR